MTHLLHITPTIKVLDEIIQLNGANRPRISTWPFVAPYISSMSHNNSVVTTLRFEYEECKNIVDNNCVPYPWIMFPFYTVNFNLNLGIQFGTFGNQGLLNLIWLMLYLKGCWTCCSLSYPLNHNSCNINPRMCTCMVSAIAPTKMFPKGSKTRAHCEHKVVYWSSI